jgi:LysR family transcriptional regulator, glycine cleavage system transcriptional activator
MLRSTMAHKHYNFPSLNGLAAFEAAGRHMSLTRAAQELNVTPGAVSKHISALEAEIGAKVFIRLHRSLELTTEGAALLFALKGAFTQIAETLDTFRKGGPKRAVTIGTTSALAQFWLMPRLGRFWHDHQDIMIDHVISDKTQESMISPVDLRVRYGSGQFQDELSTRLFDDHIMAMASPAFLKGRDIRTVAEIAAQPLLSVEGIDWTWTTWSDFLRHFNVSSKHLKARRFNSHIIAVQAALDGQGIVLGWKSFMKPLLAARRLRSIGEFAMPAPQSFHLTWSIKRPLSPEANVLKDWLLANID